MSMTKDPRRELLEYIDQLIHRSVMMVEPHKTSGDHRRRLNALQTLRRNEVALLTECLSAQDVVSTYLDRAHSGAHEDSEHNAQALGLPTMDELLDEIRGKATTLGLHCDSHLAGVSPSSTHNVHPERLHEPAEHVPKDWIAGDDMFERQNVLLDEAIEESFPASDPISVKRLV